MNKMMSWCDNKKDLGLLLIRLGVAAIFISAGWGKFTNLGMTIDGFSQIGLTSFFAYLVATVELLGGVAMLLGVFVRYAGVLLAIVMVFAIYLVKWDMGGFAASQIDIMLLVSSLGVAMIGAGKWSLGGKMSKQKSCDNCEACRGGCSMHE